MAQHLLQHLQNLKEKELFCDFEFIITNNSSSSPSSSSSSTNQIIKAHSIILKQSEYFQRLEDRVLILSDGKYDECLVRGALDCIYGNKIVEFHKVIPFLLEFEFFGVISDCIQSSKRSDQLANADYTMQVWRVLNKYKSVSSSSGGETASCMMENVMKLLVEQIRELYSIDFHLKETSDNYQKLLKCIVEFSVDEFLDFFTYFINYFSLGTISKIMIEWIKQNPSERAKQSGFVLLKLQAISPSSYIPPPPPLTLRAATSNVPPPPKLTPPQRYGPTPVPPPPLANNLLNQIRSGHMMTMLK